MATLSIASIHIADKFDRDYYATESQLTIIQSLFPHKIIAVDVTNDSFTYDGRFEHEVFNFLLERDMPEEIEALRMLFKMPWSHVQASAFQVDAPKTFCLGLRQTMDVITEAVKTVRRVMAEDKPAIRKMLAENLDTFQHVIVKSFEQVLGQFIWFSSQEDDPRSMILRQLPYPRRSADELNLRQIKQKQCVAEIRCFSRFLHHQNRKNPKGLLPINFDNIAFSIRAGKFDILIFILQQLPEYVIPHLQQQKLFHHVSGKQFSKLVDAVFPVLFYGQTDNAGYLVDPLGRRAHHYIEMMFELDDASVIIYEWLSRYSGPLLLDDTIDSERLAMHIGRVLEESFSRQDYTRAPLLRLPHIPYAVFARVFSDRSLYYCEMVLAQPMALEVMSVLAADGRFASDVANKIIDDYFY